MYLFFFLKQHSGEGNGNPLHFSCLENPMDRGAWKATVHGVPRVRYNLATKQGTQQQWQIFTSYFHQYSTQLFIASRCSRFTKASQGYYYPKGLRLLTLKRHMRPCYLNLYIHPKENLFRSSSTHLVHNNSMIVHKFYMSLQEKYCGYFCHIFLALKHLKFLM